MFDTKYPTPFPPRSYDMSADGKRFLMIKDAPAGASNASPASMVVVVNWFEELRRRVNGN